MLPYKPRVSVPSGSWRLSVWLVYIIASGDLLRVRSEFSYEAITAVLAQVNVTYVYPSSSSKPPRWEVEEMGRFADGAVLGTASGVVVAGKSRTNSTTTSLNSYQQGCSSDWASPPADEPWVALMLRGGCPDKEKVKMAVSQNASAVLLYGDDQAYHLKKETKFHGEAIVIYLLSEKGRNLTKSIKSGIKVNVVVSKGKEVRFRITSINRTSVLFVSVSFIVLMVVSLAWLIFYYIQRFRYINAKDRLAKHLNNAAKKALAKIPVRTLKTGEKAIEECESCAVCIECYVPGDNLRSLPCKHEFHKSCVDPWLLEHRTCPMCKMDILKYYGYIPSGTETPTARASSSEDTPAADSTTAANLHRSFEQTIPPIFDDAQNPIQVSVISHSEIFPVSPGESSMETRGGNSAPSDSVLSTPIPAHQTNISLGTTTAIIRSVILSSAAASPPASATACSVGDPQGTLASIHAPSASPFFGSTADGSILVQIREGGFSQLTEEEETTSNGDDTESSISDSTRNIPSPFEDYRDSTPPLKSNIEEQSSPFADPLKTPERRENTVCDIDCLVNEIFDLEPDDTTEKSDFILGKSSSPTPSAVPESKVEIDGHQERNPESDHPLNISNSSLPVVDCNNQQTNLSLALSGDSSQSFVSTVHSRNLHSSLGSEDLEEVRNYNNFTQSEDSRRPSSHLVTITHS